MSTGFGEIKKKKKGKRKQNIFPCYFIITGSVCCVFFSSDD